MIFWLGASDAAEADGLPSASVAENLRCCWTHFHDHGAPRTQRLVAQLEVLVDLWPCPDQLVLQFSRWRLGGGIRPRLQHRRDIAQESLWLRRTHNYLLAEVNGRVARIAADRLLCGDVVFSAVYQVGDGPVADLCRL